MDCNKTAEINIPEPLPDFNSENNVGSWRQLLAANIGKRVKIDISMFDGSIRSAVGDIYLVGNAYAGVISGGNIVFADIFAIKFVTFY